MAKQITIKGYIYEIDLGYEGVEKDYVLFQSADQGDKYYTLVGPAELSYTIPAEFNATAAKLAALQAKKDEAAKMFSAAVRELDEQIANLQALEYTPEAA